MLFIELYTKDSLKNDSIVFLCGLAEFTVAMFLAYQGRHFLTKYYNLQSN